MRLTFKFSLLLIVITIMFVNIVFADNVTQKVQQYAWEGTINNKIPVSVWLEIKDNLVAGEIVYTKTKEKRPITLLGRVIDIEDKIQIWLREMLPTGQITGIITGEISQNLFVGTWSTPDKITDNGHSFERIEGKSYSIQLSTSKEITIPSSVWQFHPENASGIYSYDYGPNSQSGIVELKLDQAGAVEFSIASHTDAPAFNMAHIPLDIDEEKAVGTLQGNRIIYKAENPCAFEIIFFNNFLEVQILPDKECSPFFGMGATIEGIYKKIQP